MRILAVSDRECHYLKDTLSSNETLRRSIDIAFACGDLHPEYVMFLADCLNRIVYYVNGNHLAWDVNMRMENEKHFRYMTADIPGGRDLHGKVVERGNLILCGFGGSVRYNQNAFQFTQKEMQSLVRKSMRKVLRMRFFDFLLRRPVRKVICISHAPPSGFGDVADGVHEGFDAFNKFIDKISPVLWLHGHIHLKDFTEMRIFKKDATEIINVFDFKSIELDAGGHVRAGWKLV